MRLLSTIISVKCCLLVRVNCLLTVEQRILNNLRLDPLMLDVYIVVNLDTQVLFDKAVGLPRCIKITTVSLLPVLFSPSLPDHRDV